MTPINNYQQDLIKGLEQPLLIELNYKDLKGFNEAQSGSVELGGNVAFAIARNAFNFSIKGDKVVPLENETNVVYIDTEKYKNKEQIILLDSILSIASKDIQKEYNKDIAKTTITNAVSILIGNIVDVKEISNSALDLISDTINMESIYGGVTDFIVNNAVNNIVNSPTTIAGTLSDDFLDKVLKEGLYLTSESTEELLQLSKKFGKLERTYEVIDTILKVILSSALGSPKALFIKNPQNLDKTSLALISMLLSLGKDLKDKDETTNITIIFAYEDESFQPFQDCKDEYSEIKTLLDEQRRFAQRYSMLERPTSDIPVIAVKSNVFVGREEELRKLKERYKELKTENDATYLDVIVADPGTGKTKLVKKHLENLSHDYSNSLINLQLLNQAGHMSTSTGLSSLYDSIISEANRLDREKSLFEKFTAYGKSKVTDKKAIAKKVLDIAGASLFTRAFEVGASIKDAIDIKAKVEDFSKTQERLNERKEEKERKFNFLLTAIKKLQDNSKSNENNPLILFIDDLQWIDEESAEFIKLLSDKLKIHIVATLRGSDAANALNRYIKSINLNLYRTSLLIKAGVIANEKFENSQLKSYSFNTNSITLKGLNEKNLTDLVGDCIGKKEVDYSQEMALSILKNLKDSGKEEVRALFAVETINILCDELFYKNHNFNPLIQKINNKLQFQRVKNIENDLEKIFDLLNKTYQESFESKSDNSGEFKQNFSTAAYAVMEERLVLLEEHFGKESYGNIAVKTLLFSSLLGTPFISEIVKNIIKEIVISEELLLKPIKDDINKSTDTFLYGEHYEILEEVYEILSRMLTYRDTFEYKHSLLGMFLEKQLDLYLGKTFLEEQIDSKNELFKLFINEIENIKIEQSFYDRQKDSLNSIEFEVMIQFKKAILNVERKGFLQYKDKDNIWAEDYTTSLINLAYSLKSIGETKEAIKLERESLSILKVLYNTNPSRRVEFYTTSLNNLACSLNLIGETKEAIKLERESLSILKDLYNTNPSGWAEDYTRSLNNLAASLKSTGETKEAIKLERESLSILNDLYNTNPSIWAKDYTRSLNNLAYSLNSTEKTKEANELFKELFSILKELYNTDPSRWAENYTTILNNLAASLKSIGETKEVIELERESVSILKGLYNTNPSRWAEDYTRSLNNLAASLGETKEAMELERESVSILKELYNTDPSRWAENYTTSLNNLAYSLESIGEIKEEIELLKESVSILKDLYNSNPSRWAENYTKSINNLVASLKSKGEIKETIELERESVSILKGLYNTNPSKWAEDYTTTLNNLASSLGETKETIELERESVSILKGLYNTNPSRWAEDYTTSLNNLAYSLGETKEAMELERESLSILKGLYNTNPSRWAEDYTTSLNNLAYSLESIGEIKEEIELLKESVSILKDLYNSTPSRWAEDYTTILNNLASSLLKEKRFEESSQYFANYFKVFDFDTANSVKDIIDFVYPFIKLYQCEKRLGNKHTLLELQQLADKQVEEFKIKFSDDYYQKMEKEQQEYMEFANTSSDYFDKERYKIFQEFFNI